MPFTPVHSLITLPFVRLKPAYISATALIIGSMAPDFEYFLTMHDEKHHGHTWLGSVYFDIPITILAAFAFHLVIKKNLIQNLPVYFQRRFQTLLHFDFLTYFKKHYVVFIVSAWVGTWSHFFLDSFTHQTGFFVRHLHYGNMSVDLLGSPVPMFIFLQMTCSVLGLIALACYFVLLKPEPATKLNYVPDLKYWLSTLVLALGILSLHYGVFRINLEITNFVLACIAAFVGSLIICGFLDFDTEEWT